MKPFPTYESDIYYHIGISYCRREKYHKSIYPYSRCIELNPDPIYFHERAKAYQMLGEHIKAIDDFNRVINSNNRNARAYFRRAFSYKAIDVIA